MLNSHALKIISATRVAVIQNLEPLIAVVGAALIFDESLSWVMGRGGAVILAGVFFAERPTPEAIEIQTHP